MQTLKSTDVQCRFGAVIDIAQRGKSVTTTQYERPALMLFSYKESEEPLRMRHVAAQKEWNKERRRHTTAEARALTEKQINDLIHEARK